MKTPFKLAELCSENIKSASALSPLNIAKYVGKEIPFGVGSLISLLSAGNRTLHGDFAGAGLDVGSAVASPFGPQFSLPIDAIGFARDLSRDSDPEKRKYRFDKEAGSQFRQDLEDPSAGLKSDLYQALSPMISSQADSGLKGHDAERVNNLKEQVRKGLVGLEYMTGLKKNKGETFYDEHPVEAVATDTLKNAPLIGGALGAGGLVANYRRQKHNMDITEPASMARGGNPLDTTNPANLLDPSKGEHRSDIARMFGDYEGNIDKRLELLDRLGKSSPGAAGTLSAKHKALSEQQNLLKGEHASKIQELQSQLERGGAHPEDARRIKALIDSHQHSHGKQLEELDKLKKKLITDAQKSEGTSALHKYVNLHESLRRAREKGGLKGMIGEGAKGLGGVGDLLEKYHITGAHPHYDENLIKNIVGEYAGSHVPSSEFPAIMQKILEYTGDTAHQSSGLSKALRRAKGPLLIGGAAAAGGTGLYHLLKTMQNQSYSKDKTNEWKKTLLQSRGDFEGADQIK